MGARLPCLNCGLLTDDDELRCAVCRAEDAGQLPHPPAPSLLQAAVFGRNAGRYTQHGKEPQRATTIRLIPQYNPRRRRA